MLLIKLKYPLYVIIKDSCHNDFNNSNKLYCQRHQAVFMTVSNLELFPGAQQLSALSEQCLAEQGITIWSGVPCNKHVYYLWASCMKVKAQKINGAFSISVNHYPAQFLAVSCPNQYGKNCLFVCHRLFACSRGSGTRPSSSMLGFVTIAAGSEIWARFTLP